MTTTIPPATAQKLATVHPVGTRHKAAMDIAISLIGNGLSANATYLELREKFPPDVTDKELRDIVAYADGIRPEPSTGAGSPSRPRWNGPPTAAAKPEPVKRTPLEHTDWWTSGARMSADQLAAKSPVQLPADPVECAVAAIGSIYAESDRINIVTLFDEDGGKAKPKGCGKTLARNEWLNWFEDRGVPQSNAGAWVRMNPVEAVGSGKGGAVCDSDVTAFKFVLLESDCLPLGAQIALFSRLKIPIAMVLLSGGASAHAWVKVDCENAAAYKQTVERLFYCLKPFGIDQANSNPSRLSRLPGATRKIGAQDGGLQRLLWINAHVPGLKESDFPAFEESLKFPAIEEMPMRLIAQRAVPRYEELLANVGKNGVPTGIPDLDRIMGGWKPGQTTVIAGETNHGKSTLALHMILTALSSGIGVALFSLEMDRDEIFDLIMSHEARVNRNKFNTGEFNEYDMTSIVNHIGKLSKMPLFIEDSATLGVEDIRARVNQLKADKKVGLVVVDYIQFINSPFNRDNREQQVARISHDLRTLARETRLPMLVLSQLNDEGRIRESRVISHNANIVIVVKTEGDTMKCNIVKGRGIPNGEYVMDFDRIFCLLKARPVNTTTSTYPDP